MILLFASRRDTCDHMVLRYIAALGKAAKDPKLVDVVQKLGFSAAFLEARAHVQLGDEREKAAVLVLTPR